METRKLSVLGFHPSHGGGPVSFRLRVNGNFSEARSITFSTITPPSLRFLATIVSLILAAIVLGLVWKGIGIYRIDHTSYTPADFLPPRQRNELLQPLQISTASLGQRGRVLLHIPFLLPPPDPVELFLSSCTKRMAHALGSECRHHCRCSRYHLKSRFQGCGTNHAVRR